MIDAWNFKSVVLIYRIRLQRFKAMITVLNDLILDLQIVPTESFVDRILKRPDLIINREFKVKSFEGKQIRFIFNNIL